MEKSAPLKHLEYLDGLRALAAIFVVIGHALLQVDFKQEPLVGLTKQFVEIFAYGNYAVDLFIVISGFCLMLPVIRGNMTIRGGSIEFIKRRAWRILPPYYLAMLLSLLLIFFFINQKTGTHWDVSIPVTSENIFRHILLIHDAFNDATINHAFWSIAVEWRIYFFFPLLVRCWRRIDPIKTTIFAIFASYLLHHLCWRIFGDSLDINYLGLFTMGMLAATISFSPKNVLSRWKRLPWEWIVILMTIVVVAIPSIELKFGHILSRYLVDYVVGGWCMALMMVVSLNDKHWLTQILSYRPLVFIGTFSYSIYLIHAPLLQILWQYLFIPLQKKQLLMFIALSTVGLLIIVGLSYVFFLVCEYPFMGKSKKIHK